MIIKHIFLSIIAVLALSVFPVTSHAADPVVTVLDTAVGENGTTQTARYTFITDAEFPLIISCDLSSGDVAAFQARPTSTDSWITVYSWSTGADEIKAFQPINQWRMIRSTDGTSGETVCKAINVYNQNMIPHE